MTNVGNSGIVLYLHYVLLTCWFLQILVDFFSHFLFSPHKLIKPFNMKNND